MTRTPAGKTVLLAILLLAPAAALANEFAAAITAHASAQVRPWLADPVILSAVQKQNAAHAGLTQADIDRLDQSWRAEVGAASHPMIDKVLGNDLSVFLTKKAAASNGLYTEIFVMDNRGLNVGQSEVTSDYWQGDEDKWQKTFAAGPTSMHISDVEEDESTQTYQSQLSLPLTDPATGEVIGAITIGINVEGL